MEDTVRPLSVSVAVSVSVLGSVYVSSSVSALGSVSTAQQSCEPVTALPSELDAKMDPTWMEQGNRKINPNMFPQSLKYYVLVTVHVFLVISYYV